MGRGRGAKGSYEAHLCVGRVAGRGVHRKSAQLEGEGKGGMRRVCSSGEAGGWV